MRRKGIRARTQQRSGQLSILRFRGTRESRRVNNAAFQTRLQEARRAQLPLPTETPDTSDGDRSLDGRPPTEEPPDQLVLVKAVLFYSYKFLLYAACS